MAFGYDADVTKFVGPVSQNNVRDHAFDLIGDLAAIRGTISVPIILVVHSLGGLVAKKALCLSEQAGETRLQQLHANTTGLAFLGTPHRGAGLAPFATGVARVLKAARKRVNSEILSVLQRDSEALADIDASFATWLRKRGDRVEVTCFSEEHELPGIGLVVSKESSQISGYPRYTIPANHMNMVRFSDPEDIGYRRIQHPEHVRGCLMSLSFESMNERYFETEINIEGTCTWLKYHAVYQAWLGNQRGLLWIKGKPGTGKSTLMKYALRDMKASAAWDMTILHFFFHGRGSRLQKSPVGLFRALIHQIGMVDDQYIHPLLDDFRARTSAVQSWSWTALELEEHLGSSVLPAVLMDRPVRIFIDALDECGDVAARRLVESLAKIQRLCSRSRFGLSICFSCRYYPIIAPDICEEIRVENENENDISLYIQQQLQLRIDDQPGLRLLEKAIEERSQRVFQWVVLVVPRVGWLFEEGNSVNQLLAYIKQIPAELHSLYTDIFATLISKQPARSLKLFQWVCMARKAFSISELRDAMNVDATLSMSGKTLGEWEALEDFVETEAQMRRLLVSLSGGLVELTQFGIQLIHQSVLDFLLDQGFAALALQDGGATEDRGNSPRAQRNHVGDAHHRLARSCLVYYLAVRKEYLTQFHLFQTDDILQLAENYPLLRYAVRYWLVHAMVAEESGLSQGDLSDFLPGCSNHCLEHWQFMATVFFSGSEPRPHPGTTLLHEAVISKLYSLIPVAARYMSINVVDGLGRTPLFIAAEYSRTDMVRYLLSGPFDVDINKKDREGRTALTYAAEGGEIGAFEALLNDSRMDVAANLEVEYTIRPYGRGTVMYHAACRNLSEVLRHCLRHPRLKHVDGNAVLQGTVQWTCNGNDYEDDILTPLWILLEIRRPGITLDLKAPITTVFHGEPQTFSLLLWLEGVIGANDQLKTQASAYDLGLDDVDSLGQGPLHRAIRRVGGIRGFRSTLFDGRELVIAISLLQRCQPLDVNAADNLGNTPLSLAIAEKDILVGAGTKLVEALLARPDLDVNKTVNGRHPLRLADDCRRDDIVALLLADPRLDVAAYDAWEVARRRGKQVEIRIEVTEAAAD
ncbi:hypothetical protein C8A05DRAFT_35131 [Staphylotrichum tortipilum]|uniref:Nephrocystin 3-like N-terminal domain-containing protein n=1 Tax=Staphylotrichum tortipilum TaxID=2831512 RepID=A0AAN6MJ52_9PEZI|nr:hypothetical protein C8A05DRAFT_35131 [Staphylotrichum longicolle]